MDGAAIAGIALGAPLLLILGLGAAGFFIRKGHTARRAVRYAAAPEVVWRTVTDWRGHPGWRRGVRALERLPDRNGHPVWREIRGMGSHLTSEVIVLDEADRRMVTKIVDESAFGGTWTWQVADAPGGAGCVLAIDEDGAIHNPVFRAVSALFRDPRATMDRLHRDLKAKLGEPPPVWE